MKKLKGAALAEYAMILALVLVVAAGTLVVLGGNSSTLFSDVAAIILAILPIT